MGHCRGQYLPVAVAANNDVVNRSVTRKGDSHTRPPLLYLYGGQMHNQETIAGMGGAPENLPFFYTRKRGDTTDTSATTATNLIGNRLGRK